MNKLGIYIHIPFCRKKCDYCDFVSYMNKTELIEKYIETVKREILENKEQAKIYEISTIYFGGGTPSSINSKYIVDILNMLRENYKIMPNAEITIEVNPGTVTKEKLQDYYNSGINRLSIGLQSTNDDLLKLIGRIHTYKDFLDTYDLSKEIGFTNINVDLMIGLPTQNIIDVEESLKKIIKLNPNHISVYSLIVEEGTKIEEKISKNELKLPKEKLERAMYWKVKETLERAGYTHYEISNFCKKGFHSNHNLDCWNQEEYLGFGVAAHSYINKKRYSNFSTIEEYLEGSFKKILHEEQNKEEQMKEFMLLALRKIEGVNISKFKEKFGENPIYLFKENLNKLVEENLLIIEENNIKLTNKGIDLANLVWEEFV